MPHVLLRSAVFSALIAALPLMGSAAVGTPDAAFARKAAQAGMTEVKLAAVALQKSRNPSVIAFAREMDADHRKANAQLTSIVQTKGMLPPSDLGAANERLMAKLAALTGPAFDALYLKSQLPAHKKVLTLFEHEAASGQDSDLVAFAKQTIPVIESHISMDRRDISKVSTIGM